MAETQIIHQTKEEKIKELETLTIKILGGIRLLFILLTIGVIARHTTQHIWATYILDTSIVLFTIIITYITAKAEKKQKRRGEKEWDSSQN